MKPTFKSLCISGVGLLLLVTSAQADPSGGQVFYQYGWNMLAKDRGNQVFTDTDGLGGTFNNGTGGWNMGAGLDLPIIKNAGPGDLLGEIVADYSRFSNATVLQTTSALLGGKATTTVNVTELEVVIAPKYRFSLFDGKFRPWIIPAGLAFMVNSPPSNDSGYLDIGYHAGVGAEYMFISELSLGVDYRYTIAAGESGVNMSGGQFDIYLGINF